MAVDTIFIDDAHEVPLTTGPTGFLTPSGARPSWTKTGPRQWRAELRGATYDVLLLEWDAAEETALLRVNGKKTRCKIKPREAALAETIGVERMAAAVAADVKAPMPGLVREVRVTAGQSVAAGDPLLVLEAMKMENVLKSPADGVVAEVPVAAGDAVDKNQPLIIFES